MQTQPNAFSASSAFGAASVFGASIDAVRFAPPPHVRRWTGRAALTIPLPSLAALRISSIPASGRDTSDARA